MNSGYAARLGRGVPRMGLIATMLLGAALRIALLTDFRFHADEALFAALGRLIISGHDPLLADTTLLVDKPPLFYYTLAALISICWGCELTARLAAFFSSMLTIALTARLARAVSDSRDAPLLAALIIAVSPMAVSFSATVFADPLMVMWLSLATVLVVEKRPGWAGLSFGLALASKQNAILFTPLLMWLLGIAADRATPRVYRAYLRFVLGLSVIILMMLVWDIARNPEAGVWQTGLLRNDPGRLIRRGEVLPRLSGWWSLFATYTPAWPLTAIVLLIGAVWPFIQVAARPRQRSTMLALALSVFAMGYFAFHWLVAFPLFDRYFLVLIPFVSVLSASALPHILFFVRPDLRVLSLTGIFLVALLISPPISEAGVGGDHGANDGIDQVAAYLNRQPDGSIVYHRSLGWLASYYFLDSYLVPVTIDSPEALSADLRAFAADNSKRYLVLTPADGELEMKRAIELAGYGCQSVLVTTNRHGQPTFTILELTN